jgi:hypothetical protein
MIAGLMIYAMALPLLIIDVSCTVFHAIFFSIRGMPKTPRRNYVIIDYGRLKNLNWMQKTNCIYCDYANGLIAWAKAVINTTEVYSCAIKHGSGGHGREHQKDFYEPGEAPHA